MKSALFGVGSCLFTGADRKVGPWHGHPLGGGWVWGSLSAAALPASCFPDSSEEWKRNSELRKLFYDVHKHCKFCALTDMGLALLEPLATGNSPVSSEKLFQESLWELKALSLFIFLPQWERLTLTFLSCLCLHIFIYPVNLGRNLSKRQGRLALGVGRLVFETLFWHLLTMWPWASHCVSLNLFLHL